jgi:hypothetical protein
MSAMAWFRSRLRLSGSALALGAWLFLVSHLCIDAGDVHAEIITVEGHGSGESHDEHGAAVHHDCLSAIASTVGQNHGCSPAAPDALPWHATSSPGIQALPNSSGVDPPLDFALVRSGPPLFLLHSALLI